MNRFVIFSLLAAILLVGCSDRPAPLIPAPNAGKLEDEETIAFSGTLRTEDTDWHLSDDGLTQVISFNKADYPQAKRATFATMIRTSSNDNKVYAQLYNLTDSTRVAGTDLYANCECFRWVESEDILERLPNKPVMLALRIRSEKEGFFVMTNYNSFLTMFNR